MKILQIINCLATGGAEKLLLETIPLYRKKGIEMDILVLNGTNYPFMKQLMEIDCCNVYSLGSKSVYNPSAIFKIIPYLRKYDLVHIHLFPAQYFVVLAKLVSFSKVKLVFTEHNTANRRMGNTFFRLFDQFIYSHYQTVICITNEVKQILEKHIGLSNNRLVVIENGVNIEAIKKSKSYTKDKIHSGIDKEDTLIIQVSGFREQKDQPTLIRSLRFLPDTYKVLLVGEGVMQKICEDLVQELQLQNRVFFLGLRMDVPQLLKTSDIVVLSSKYEGLSLSSIEGMASGKPFIASNVPGLEGIVSGAGIVFDQGNAKELAVAIEKLMKNPDYCQAVAKACQERANQYDINVMVDKHIQLYESIS
jgi:glycosyltransferase involved in cell wall biosynthesis